MKKLLVLVLLVVGGCVEATDHADESIVAHRGEPSPVGGGAGGSAGVWVTAGSGGITGVIGAQGGSPGTWITSTGGAAGAGGDVPSGSGGMTATSVGGATGAGGAVTGVAGAGGSGGCGGQTLLPYGAACDGHDEVCTSHHCTDNGGGVPPFCGCVYSLDCSGTANICDHNTCVTQAGIDAPLQIRTSTSLTYVYDVQCRNDLDCSTLVLPGETLGDTGSAPGSEVFCVRPGNSYAGLCEYRFISNTPF